MYSTETINFVSAVYSKILLFSHGTVHMICGCDFVVIFLMLERDGAEEMLSATCAHDDIFNVAK
jgi:hypothetical protein